MPTHRNTGLFAEESFFEFQRQVFAKICAALHAAATSSASSEHVAEAEELAEDVAEVLEDTGIETTTLSGPPAQSRVAVAIVGGALFRVGEHSVSFAYFFEFFFGIRIIRIAVGMILERKFAVGALEFYFRNRAGHAQYFVVIAFCVGGQNMPFFIMCISWLHRYIGAHDSPR
jgi:hypothetical protein